MYIKEVCERTNLTKKAIEYYQYKDLISPAIEENGYRKFVNSDVEKLKKIKLFRDIGLSVEEIKAIFKTNMQAEELKKAVIRKNLESQINDLEIKILYDVLNGNEDERLIKKLEKLKSEKSIKVKILEAFPGFYGRFFMLHFNLFLDDMIKTKAQENAYINIINFLDNIDSLELPEDMIEQLEEAMDFWDDEKINKMNKKKIDDFKNPQKFIDENFENMSKYMDYKETKEFEDSIASELLSLMRTFTDESGYNDIMIENMKVLSPKYNEYYNNLLKVNNLFLQRLKEKKQMKI